MYDTRLYNLMKIYKMICLQCCRWQLWDGEGRAGGEHELLSESRTHIGEIVTDRHPMIVKHIREQMKDTKHSSDVLKKNLCIHFSECDSGIGVFYKI